ncbi:MAG: arylsulfatase, partial [Rhizobiales bacterium 35-66-30]
MVGSGAALLGAHLLPDLANAQPAKSASRPAVSVAPERPPAGYNILFILVDQEHYFEKWPFPVPAREWLKANGIYQGKWHLSYNLDKAKHADEAPMAEYRKTMESYGFQDFFGFGDITDTTLGGYDYDATTSAFVERWMRTKGLKLKESGTPWYLAVNFVNPHDVMYVNSDMPGETVQGRKSAMAIARPPDDDIYAAKWDAPLPSTRSQPFDAPGRPPAHLIYQDVQDTLVGAWPDEDRRWRVLRDYYFNCIRDCDR